MNCAALYACGDFSRHYLRIPYMDRLKMFHVDCAYVDFFVTWKCYALVGEIRI